MKKNIKTIVCAALATVVMAASALAGCTGGNECNHDVKQWKYTTGKESTCTTEGEQMGNCTICGDVVIRTAPVDPDNHDYGDWAINAPTEEKEGSAVKTCSREGSHKLEVTLPKVTLKGEGYDYAQMIKFPTAAEEGKLHLELKNDKGDISFDVVLPKRVVETVADAVELGSSLGAYVRRTSGTYKEGDSYSAEAPTTPVEKLHDFSCEYGDDYTHIIDQGNRLEYWYSRDDEGNPFGVQQEIVGDLRSEPVVVMGVSEKELLGYAYQSVDGVTRYGAEDALATVYGASQTPAAVLFDKSEISKDKDTDEISASFHYSMYTAPSFYRYNVEFTLYSTGVIKSLRIDFKMFRPYMIKMDDKGNPVYQENGDIEFAIDEDTGLPYSDKHKEVVNQYIYYKEQIPKAEGDVVPENPYTSDVRYIHGFDVEYNGVAVGDEKVEIIANKDVSFKIDNVTPSTATLDYDPLEIFLRVGTRDIRVTINAADNSKRLIGFFSQERKVVTIKSETAGEMTIVLKTKGGKCEKVINLNVTRSAVPTSLTAQAYEAMAVSGREVYQWNNYDVNPDSQEKVSMYVGQPMKIRAVVPSEEAGYVSLNFIAEVDAAANDYTLTEGQMDNLKYYEFAAKKAGEYYVYLTSDKSETVYTYIILDVQPVPDASEILTGEYEAVVNELKVDGNRYLSAVVNIVITPDADWHTGTITVTVADDTSAEKTTTYLSYVYSEETGLKTQITGGVNTETFDYEFAINGNYQLTVTHTGLLDEKKTSICSRPVPEEEGPETPEVTA